MNARRTAPAHPRTITTSRSQWLQDNAPHLERVLQRIPAGEELMVPNRLLYNSPQTLWQTLPNGGKSVEGWVLLRDGVAKIKLVGRSMSSWGYLHQPAFKLTDLSSIFDLQVNATGAFTFLIGEAACTFFANEGEGCALVEATIIKAE